MDSLRQNILDAKGNDSLQSERYIDMAFEILFNTTDDLEKGIENINKAIALSEKKPHIGLLMSEYNYIGTVRREQGRSQESIDAYQKALSLGEEQYKTATAKRKQTLDKHIPYIKGNIASVYNRQGKLEKALAMRLSVIEDLKKQLSSIEFKVTQKEGTEPAFKNRFWNHSEEGIYVDIVSGEPLFISTDKFKSGTGWPSFYQPLEKKNIVLKKDFSRRGNLNSLVYMILSAIVFLVITISLFRISEVNLSFIYFYWLVCFCLIFCYWINKFSIRDNS